MPRLGPPPSRPAFRDDRLIHMRQILIPFVRTLARISALEDFERRNGKSNNRRRRKRKLNES